MPIRQRSLSESPTEIRPMNLLLNPQEIVKSNVSQFAQFFRAYQECTVDVQAIVNEMAEIVADPDSTSDEREHAVEVMVEALVPGLATDLVVGHKRFMKSADYREAKVALEEQERHFADTVRDLMKAKSLTQETLAEQTGVSQPAISNILTRRCRPQQRTVLRFAEALGCDPEYLWPPLRDE